MGSGVTVVATKNRALFKSELFFRTRRGGYFLLTRGFEADSRINRCLKTYSAGPNNYLCAVLGGDYGTCREAVSEHAQGSEWTPCPAIPGTITGAVHSGLSDYMYCRSSDLIAVNFLAFRFITAKSNLLSSQRRRHGIALQMQWTSAPAPFETSLLFCQPRLEFGLDCSEHRGRPDAVEWGQAEV